MATNTGLNAYSLQMKPGRRGTWRTFHLDGDFDGFSRLVGYFQSIEGELLHFGDQDPATGIWSDPRAMRLATFNFDRPSRSMSGRFVSGKSGQVLDVINVETDTQTKRIEKDEAPFAPLYFRINVPDGVSEAVLLLQRQGLSGLKSSLVPKLQEYLASDPERITIKVTALADAQVLRRFATHADLGEVILVNRGRSPDTRAVLRRIAVGGTRLDQGDTLQVSIKKSGDWGAPVLQLLRRIVRAEQPPSALVTVPGLDGVDEVLVRLKHENQWQTFSLTRPDESLVKWDISHRVVIGADGHPTFESIDAAAADVFEAVRELLY